MPANLIQKRRIKLGADAFAELSIWGLPEPLPGSSHPFKYRLAFVVNGVCVLRYDNEAGKGDHKHLGEREVPYLFTDLEQLAADFWADVSSWGG